MVSPVAVVCVCVCLCACVERQNDLLSLDLMPVRQDCSGVSVLVCGNLQLVSVLVGGNLQLVSVLVCGNLQLVSVLVCGNLQLGGHICIRLRCGVSV